jgi:gliding motility-associated-like protein
MMRGLTPPAILLPKRFLSISKSVVFTFILVCIGVVTSFAATITSFAPAKGPAGTLVTIKGWTLQGAHIVNIGGVPATIVSKTDKEIVAMVMPGATTGAVSITLLGRTVSAATTFTVEATPYPIMQQGRKLVDTVKTKNFLLDYSRKQGAAVAVSADGNTAIVAEPLAFNFFGGVMIYVRHNGRWNQAGQLIHVEAVAGMGSSVAISADGSTAVVGGFYSTAASPVTVLKQVNGSWANPAIQYLRNNDAPEPGAFFPPPPHVIGNTVSITADGKTILIGNDRAFYSTGGYNANVKIYNQTGTEWVQAPTPQAGPKFLGYNPRHVLVPPVGIGAAISANGKTIALIAQSAGGGRGSAATPGYTAIYSRPSRTSNDWKPEKVLGEYAKVTLSADGNTLAATIATSTYDPATLPGYTDIYARSGATWTLVQTINETGQAALSADGKTLMMANNATVYTRTGATYAQKMVLKAGYKGLAASLSANGTTAFIGNPNDNTTPEYHGDGTPGLDYSGNGEIGAVYAFSSAPQDVPASAITFSNFTDTTTTISWEKGSGTGRTVFVKETAAGVPPPPPNIYLQGINQYLMGLQFDGWAVVYNGNGSTVNVKGLKSNKTYRAAVIEYNGTLNEPVYSLTNIPAANVTIPVPVTAPTTPATRLEFANNTLPQGGTLFWLSGSGVARSVFIKVGASGKPSPSDGYLYAASNNPYTQGSPIHQDVDNSEWYCVYTGTLSYVDINGLLPSTTYRVAVVEYQGGAAGAPTVYDKNFNMLDFTMPALLAPTQPVPYFQFSNTTATTSTLTWTHADGAARAVFVRNTPGGGYQVQDFFTHTANTTFGLGSTLPTVAGWYCVYNGTGTTVDISGLQPSTHYYGLVVEYNGGPGQERYAHVASGTEVTTTAAPTMLLTTNEKRTLMEQEGLTDNITPELNIHQGLSPNGDGDNDVFTIDGIGAYPHNTLKVMNSKGNVIYTASGYDNYQKAFDGHATNGTLQKAGTYFYSLEYKKGTETIRKTGYLVIKY